MRTVAGASQLLAPLFPCGGIATVPTSPSRHTASVLPSLPWQPPHRPLSPTTLVAAAAARHPPACASLAVPACPDWPLRSPSHHPPPQRRWAPSRSVAAVAARSAPGSRPGCSGLDAALGAQEEAAAVAAEGHRADSGRSGDKDDAFAAGGAAGAQRRPGPGRPRRVTCYGVAAGRRTGVFRSWEAVQEVVAGYSGAVFRKFSSVEAAQEYVEAHGRAAAAAGALAARGDASGAGGGAGAEPDSDGRPFYAVARGLKVGVFRTWEATEAAVKGVSGPLFRRFKTRSEAEAFIAANSGRHAAGAGAGQHADTAAAAAQSGAAAAGAGPEAAAAAGAAEARAASGDRAEGSGGGAGPGRGDAAPRGKAFYAVAIGRQPGVYGSWAEADAQVSGFKGAVHMRFTDLAAAQEFVASGGGSEWSRRAARAGPQPQAAPRAEPQAAPKQGEAQPQPQPRQPQPGAGAAAGASGAAAAPARKRGRPRKDAAPSPPPASEPAAQSGPPAEAEAGAGPGPQAGAAGAAEEEEDGAAPELDFEALGGPIDPQRLYMLEFDGGSRRNPGDAGFGAVLLEAPSGGAAGRGRHVEYVAGPLSAASNNVAEWTALAAGLQVALELGVRRLLVRGDSELVCRQVSGLYGVNKPALQPLAARVRRMWGAFEAISIEHVPRKRNALADALSNLAMDAEVAVAEAAREARLAAALEPAAGAAADARLAQMLEQLGERALRAAREAAAASAAEPLASANLTTAAARHDGAESSGRKRATTYTQITVTECAAPLAARGTQAGGREARFKRILLALAAAGHGLLG